MSPPAIIGAIIGAVQAGIAATAAAAPLIGAAGTGLAVVGTFQQAEAAKKAAEAANTAAEYNARILEENAKRADIVAAEELEVGEKRENLLRAEARVLKGKQRSAFAASGVLVDSGSTLDILTGTDRITEVDALTIRENALKRAKGVTREGTGFLSQADLSRAGKVNPGSLASTSLLTGLGKLALNFSRSRTRTQSRKR